MRRFDLGKITGAVRGAAASLKHEYDAGKRGDDAPVTPLWRSPREQLDAVLALLRAARPAPAAGEPAAADDATAGGSAASDAAADELAADEVAEALGGVDWHAARAAMAERTSEAARTVRSMADHVDWGRVQPVAAQVSSALIAAVASGQLGVGGRLGPTIARAIVDQGLAQRVGARVQQHADRGEPGATLPDFRGAIEATSREC